MDNNLKISARPNPVTGETLRCFVQAGQTVSELFPDISPQVQVEINGELLRRREYDSYRLQESDIVQIFRFPAGGEQGKDIARTAALIAVVVAATAATAGIAGPGASAGLIALEVGAKAALTLAGSALVYHLIPPPELLSSDTQGEPFNRLGALTGSRNRLSPYSVVPRIYGRHKFYPPMSAQPFTKVIGHHQYLNLLFNLGPGPLKLSDPKIGGTSIGSFDADNNFISSGAYEDVRIDVGESPSGYSQDVDEQNPGTSLNDANDSAIHTTQADVQEISVDVTFPGGLFGVSGGELITQQVKFKAEYRKVPENFTAAEVDAAADSITIAGHRFRDGDIVQFSTTGSLPGGLSAGTDYHIVNVNGDTFQVSTTAGGAAVDLTSGGSGTHTITQEWIGTVERVTYVRWERDVVDEPLTFLATSDAKETYRCGTSWTIPFPATFDVRLTRVSTAGGADSQDAATWSALRSIKYQDSTNLPGTVQIAMEIKATDQLNGVLDNFSIVAESRLATYDDVTDTWDEPVFDPDTGEGAGGALTSNPAWIYADILTGSANARAISKDRLDGAALKAWADAAATAGFEYNGVIDSKTTVLQLARSVAAAGRASYALQDGKHTVVRDLSGQTPVQMFTPRNSWGFGASKTFLDIPHGLRVRFRNELSDFKTEENIIYADGYSADGTNCLFPDGTGICKTATRFETLELDGVTNWEQAWKIGRYRLAEARLRPEVYSLNCDIEHLRCQRGDLVKASHDVTLWGSRWGRITGVTRNASNQVTQIRLDEPAQMESGKTYQIRVRLDDSTFSVIDVDTQPGETQLLTVTTPAAFDISAGDLFAFGEESVETVDLKVIAVEPQPDHSARLTLVDAAPEIHNADTGAVPPFDPQITEPPQQDFDRTIPPAPSVDSIRSDNNSLYRDDDGSYHLRLLVSFSVSGGKPSLEVEARYRRSDTTEGWSDLAKADANLGVVSLDNVERGKAYIIQVRSRYKGQTSDWVELGPHTVTGKNEAPKDVTGFAAVLDQVVIRLSWNDVDEPDVKRYEIREGTVWDTATLLGFIDGTETTIKVTDTGTQNFLVKAIDTAGNTSAAATAASVDVPADWLNDVVRSGGTPSFDQITLASPATLTGHAVRADRTLSIAGTTGQISVAGGTQNLTANRVWTLSLPAPLTTPGAILPAAAYAHDLGSLTKKWRTLHASELAVELLTTSNRRVTSGGRFNVATGAATLETGIDATATTITVSNNGASNGDIIHFEKAGQVEFIGIDGHDIVAVDVTGNVIDLSGDVSVSYTVGDTIVVQGRLAADETFTIASVVFNGTSGNTEITVNEDITDGTVAGAVVYKGAVSPFTYVLVTRNLDGSGANAWSAGDAFLNTGQIGSGFIDLYAVNSLKTGVSTAGPAIAHMVRTGMGANDIDVRAASGNLKGWYGYISDTFGFAAGVESGANVTVDNSALKFRDGAEVLAKLSGSEFLLGSATQYFKIINTGGVVSADMKLSSFNLNAGAGALLLDSATKAFSLGNSTFGQTGIQAQYNAGAPRIFAGHAPTNTNSLSYDGVDDYVEIPDHVIGGLGAFTIEAWVNPNDFTVPRMGVVARWDDLADEQSVLTRIDGGNIDFFVNNGSHVQAGGTFGSAAAGVWQHLAFVYDGAELRVYLNGVEIGTPIAHSGTVNIADVLHIGGKPETASSENWWNGGIDDVRIWSDVRTQQEIRDNMQVELQGTEANLIAYYKLNEGSGTVAGDSTANNHDGSLVGGVTWSSDVPFTGERFIKFDGTEVDILGRINATSGLLGNLDVQGVLTMGVGGEITNAAGDYNINNEGIAINVDQPNRLTFVEGGTVRSRIYHDTTFERLKLVALGSGLDASSIELEATNEIRLTPTGDLLLNNLPASPPAGSNRVWNDGGTLKIT